MTAAAAKAQLQADLLKSVRYMGKLEGWFVGERVGKLGYEYGDDTVKGWVCEVLTPLGEVGRNSCMWIERRDADVEVGR